MENEVATQSGAEPATQSAPAPSIHDRIKAAISTPEQSAPVKSSEDSSAPAPKAEKLAPIAAEAETADPETAEAVDVPEELSFTSFKELAEAAGLDMEKLYDFEIPTKVDGKEGSVKLRDMQKSYQLEQHLNQKLMTHAEERKAFEGEAQRKNQEMQAKAQQLDAAVMVAQKLLDGDLASIDWQGLQQNDPLAYDQKYREMDQRQRQINHLAEQLGQERQQREAQQLAAFNAYKAEQGKLLDSKLPEWADTATRNKDIAEMATILNDAYGVSEKELRSEVDHRLILIARDAAKYQKLMKAKPEVLNKVRAAPKLIKPGVPQSQSDKDSFELKGARDRLRSTGKVQDAKAVLKQLLFR